MTRSTRRSASAQRKTDASPARHEATTPAQTTTVDPSDERTTPDAPVAHVIRHARTLASRVRVHAALLVGAKVTVADADALDAHALALEDAERIWLHRHDAQETGQVPRLRVPVREGRDDLFDALRTFADENPTTQRALDDIAGVDGDDDLVQDTERLLALATLHRPELEGTEITPTKLAALRSALSSFQQARSVARAAGRAVETDVLAAHAARNRAFWALSRLDRMVVKRCRFALRRDPEREGLFTGYHNALRRRRRTEAAPTPAAPATPTATD